MIKSSKWQISVMLRFHQSFVTILIFFPLKSILVYTTTNSLQFFSSESKTWRFSCQRMVNSCTCTVCMWLDNLPHLPQHIDLCWHKKQSQSLNQVAFILPKIWVYRNLWNTEKLVLLIPDLLIFVLKPNMPITGMNALVQFSDLWLVFYHFKSNHLSTWNPMMPLYYEALFHASSIRKNNSVRQPNG